MTPSASSKFCRRVTLLVALIVAPIATASTHAQASAPVSRTRNVVSAGLQVADESNGEIGVAIAIERNLFQLSHRVSLGGGITTGIRRSHFEGILGSDYSVIVVPVSGMLNLHYRIPNAPRLDMYAGLNAGVSLRRYQSKSCALEFDCVAERSSPTAAGIQWGARWTLRNSLHAWSEASAGKQGFTFAIGLSRPF